MTFALLQHISKEKMRYIQYSDMDKKKITEFETLRVGL